jgi:hypothetical protein
MADAFILKYMEKKIYETNLQRYIPFCEIKYNSMINLSTFIEIDQLIT